MASQIRKIGVTALSLAAGGYIANWTLRENDHLFQKVSSFRNLSNIFYLNY